MKKILLFCLVCLVAFAADFTLDNKALTVEFSLKGGGISSLVRKKNNAVLCYPGYNSVTERVFAQDGEFSNWERFTELDYRLVEMTCPPNHEVTLTCKGAACFDWLRITKHFQFPRGKEFFTVTYTLRNLDDKPHYAGLWLQSFFALYDPAGSANLILQPRNGELVELNHPGNAINNEWSPNPGVSLTSIGGKETNQGIVMSIPPEYCAGFYCWCSTRLGSTVNTCEMITRELEIPPHSELSFQASYTVSDNAAALARSLAKKPEYQIGEKVLGREACAFEGTPTYLPQKQLATGVFEESKRFMDFLIPRQFNETIRSAVLPPDAEPERVAVYEVRNKRVDVDRPLPVKVKILPDGSKQLLFKVPALGGHGFYYTEFKDGLAFEKFGPYQPRPCLGEVNMLCRIVLDAPPNSSPALEAEAPELRFNGSFEIPNQENTFAAGNPWHTLTLDRKQHFWEKGAGRNGSYGIRLKQEGTMNSTPLFNSFFVAEPGRSYTASLWVRCENPDQKYALVQVYPYDAGGKTIAASKVTIDVSKVSYGWKKLTKTFHLPKEAVTFSIGCQTSRDSKELTMWIDDVSVVAEDYLFVPKPVVESTRETAILNGYAPLTLMEKIDHGYVTPHEEWFKPAAYELPQLLYLCTIIGTNEDASRRQIVELAQRMDLSYEFIPLLPKLNGIKSNYAFGVGEPLLDDYFEPYSIERIKALKTLPKVALVQGVEFDKRDSNHALRDILAELQAKGTAMVFLNCDKVPEELLGKAMKDVPPEWNLIPWMNNVKKVNRYMVAYEKAFTFNFSNSHYFFLQLFPSTPPEMSSQLSPAYFSRDFPFWEYSYLPLIKGIRQKAGVVPDAAFTAAEYKDGALAFGVKAQRELKATLSLEYRTTFRSTDATVSQELSLVAGENAVAVTPPELPGGCHILHYKLLTADSKVLDAGALRFDTPIASHISIEYASPERIYATGKPVEFTVVTENIQPGDAIEVTMEDTEFRVVAKASKPADAKVPFALEIPAPYTILYRVFARLVRNGKVQSQLMGEISLPDRKLDPCDYHAGVWGGRLLLSKMLRDLGFELLSCEGRNNNVINGILRNELNLGFYPLVLNLGHVANPRTNVYRSDVVTDPVRDPCYHDPDVVKQATEGIHEKQRMNQSRYYACFYNELGDEQFLGSTVCYSQYCLTEFRKVLKAQYGTIERLNQEWGTQYASFDEATPVQKEAVANSDNLSQWLDHKMFMSGVFAHQFVGKREEIIQEEVPGALVGLSGTQVPGYGYDWAQLMKHCTCISYYNGVQTSLINDFALPGTLLGQWGCGYVGSEKISEIYERSSQWSNLLKGANTSWNFHGSSYNGDGSPTGNLKVYCEEFQLFKRGLARLLLTADQETRPVAVLYSQPSLFVAMNGGIGVSDWQNTQTGWDELLRDLKISFRFISYEELAAPDFASRGFKAVVLPMALSLSDAERANLVKAAEKGATIIADVAPGRYDGHGKRIANTVLDKLFPPNPGPIVPAAIKIAQGPLNARLRVAEPDLGCLLETSCGKGRGILMNTMMNSYQAMTMGGVGGELASAASGTQAFCLSMQKAVLELLQKANVKPFATVLDANGNHYPSQAVLRKAGDNYYFGIIPHSNARGGAMIDHANSPTVKVTLPVKGVIYDLRKSEKIADGNTISIKAPVGYGQLFSILPKTVDKPAIKIPASVKPGETISLICTAKGAVSKTVYRLEVTLPDGTSPQIYAQNATFPKPEGKFAFQVPYNAQQGKWTVAITHVPSGARNTATFAVK